VQSDEDDQEGLVYHGVAIERGSVRRYEVGI
jgi:hypothetical protein